MDVYEEMETQRQRDKLERAKIKSAAKTRRTILILSVVIGSAVIIILFIRRQIRNAKLSLNRGGVSGSFDIPIVGKMLEMALGVDNLPTPARRAKAARIMSSPFESQQIVSTGDGASESYNTLKLGEEIAHAKGGVGGMALIASMWKDAPSAYVPKIDMPTCVGMFDVAIEDSSKLEMMSEAMRRFKMAATWNGEEEAKAAANASSKDGTSLVVMVYRADCVPCAKAAPVFASKAKDVMSQSSCKVLFGRIDTRDVPMTIAAHMPPTVPAFLVYDAKLDTLTVTHIEGGQDLGASLDALCSSLSA